MFSWISIPELFLYTSLLAILFLGFLNQVRQVALSFALISVVWSLFGLYYAYNPNLPANYVGFEWLTLLGNDLSLRLDGMSAILCFLSSFTTLCAIVLTPKTLAKQRSLFMLIFALLFGLQGVFMAWNLLSFYIMFEIVLIPSYFLAINWGNAQSLHSTQKFFLYTFLGSLFMLGAILMLYVNSIDYSLRWDHLIVSTLQLSPVQRAVFFACFIFAFAIKMPIFPFHTWQPALYRNAPIPVVLLLSGVMVKMGLYGIVRWMMPFFSANQWQEYAIYPIVLSAIGVVYASILAIGQKNLRALVAYSSIAHIGFMSVAILVRNREGLDGAILQMLNHGINVGVLWILVDYLERKFSSSNYADLQGLIGKNSWLGAFFIIASLANIALPLTNSFVGEFSMLYGIAKYNIYLASVVGLSVILSAVYMLIACVKIIYGPYHHAQEIKAISPKNHYVLLGILSLIVFFVGLYSQPLFLLIKQGITQIS